MDVLTAGKGRVNMFRVQTATAQEAELSGLSLSPIPVTGKQLDQPAKESLTGIFFNNH